MNTLETLFACITIIISIYVPLWMFSQTNKKKQFNTLLKKVSDISDNMIGSRKDIENNKDKIIVNKVSITKLEETQKEHGKDIIALKTKISINEK